MIKEMAFAGIDRNRQEIAKVGDAIFSFAELGMQEYETCRLCAAVFTDMGFEVRTGISGFPTAIMASCGTGRPVLAAHVEYDAVPGGSQYAGVAKRREIVASAPGHAEGHNTNAAAWIGAAFAVKEAIDAHRLRGTVKFFSAPAEEQLISRPYFVRDGYFKDIDAAFHVHVGHTLSTSYGIRQYALLSVEYEFFGRAAHSGTSPWTGASAVDAMKLMDIGWDVLREHLPPSQRSHSVMVHGGAQPNVVPDYAKIWYFFRDSTYEGAKNLLGRADRVAEGAALMTGTTWKRTVLSACWPTRDNQKMAEIIQDNIELVGMPQWTRKEQQLAKAIQRAAGGEETGLATGSEPLGKAVQRTSANDSGDISWTVPHGRITIPTNVSNISGHHWAAAVAGATSIAHKGEVAGAKVLAGSMIDLLLEPGLVAAVKESFRRETAAALYTPLLPPDQKPPLTLNAEEMARYRDLMRPHYLKVNIRFTR